MRPAVSLDNPAMRVGVAVPVTVLLAYSALDGRVARPGLVLGLLAVGVGLALVSIVLATRGIGPSDGLTLATAMVGIGLLPVLLVEGFAARVETFGLLFAVVAVIVAFTMEGWRRGVVLAWLLLVWLLTLWWGSPHDADLLLIHLGGGLVLVATVVRTANALGYTIRSEARAREETERRAALLARLLQVHALDRDEVLEAVVDGLVSAGFDAASLRIVEDGRLRLAAGRGGEAVDMPTQVGIDSSLPGRCARSGSAQTVVAGAEAAALDLPAGVQGAVAVPVQVHGRLEAVLSAASLDAPVTDEQLETVELLAAMAGRALGRAADYEVDEATMEQLRVLEARTQDFVSTVSHELRTPLTVVQGLGSTLATRWDDLDPQRRDDLLRRVDANASRLADMVRSLLDTSAFEEGRIEVQAADVGLRDLVESVLHRHPGLTASHPVIVDVEGDTRVRADRSLLDHVLENLVSNAARHTPEGTAITVAAEQLDGQVEVSVSDEGPGIPEADLPHVLERFYRGGEPSERPAGGLGLGLALAQDILEAHGSALSLGNVEGHGARFAFRLPVSHG